MLLLVLALASDNGALSYRSSHDDCRVNDGVGADVYGDADGSDGGLRDVSASVDVSVGTGDAGAVSCNTVGVIFFLLYTLCFRVVLLLMVLHKTLQKTVSLILFL